MKTFSKICDLVQYLEHEDAGSPEISAYRCVLKDNEELIGLLSLLEEVNPCGQEYCLHRGIILVSYLHHLNLLNFTKKFNLKAKVRIIGLPVSLSLSGILTKRRLSTIEMESIKLKIREALKEMKGLTLVLNSVFPFYSSSRTLSAFVFHNRFSDFAEYVDALRAPYRRKIMRTLERGKDLQFIPIPSCAFTEEHYALYLSIMDRTQNPLETLSIDFFQGYDAEIIEVRDVKSRLVGFVQMKGTGSTLYFMFCGFRKEPDVTGRKGAAVFNETEIGDAVEIRHNDLYYSMLLFIIRDGIEKGYERIEMGQTSEETKLKLGCVEVEKYLFLHHGNPVIDAVLQKLSPRFSYKGYETLHHVFREEKKSPGHVAMERKMG